MRQIFTFSVCGGLMLLVFGCATVPRDAGFDDVRKSTQDRVGQTIQWRGRTAEDREVDSAVHDLLSRELSVESAVQIALLNNRNLQATYEELGIAQADVVQAGLLKNPVFSASYRFPEAGVGSPDIELGITQDFLDILQMPMRKKIAAAEFEAAKLRVASSVHQLSVEVTSTFYTLQAAQQMLELRRSIVEATDASAETARRLHDAGNITELDFVAEQALFEQSKIDLREAETEISDQREKLNTLMGLWGESTRWTIAAHLPDVPREDFTTKDLENLAIAQRLDLAAANQDVEIAARVLGMTRPFSNSDIEIGANGEREVDGQWIIGPTASVPIPLFDQGQARTARAQAEFHRAQQKYAAMTVEVRSQVRAAKVRMLAAGDRATNYRNIMLPLRHKIVEQSQLQANAMLINVFQVLEAKRGEIDAGQSYVEAIRDYWVARCELQNAVGGRLPAAVVAETSPATLPTTRESSPQQHHHHGD